MKYLSILALIALAIALLVLAWEINRWTPFLPHWLEERIKAQLFTALIIYATFRNPPKAFSSVPGFIAHTRRHMRAQRIRREKTRIREIESQLFDCITAMPYTLREKRQARVSEVLYSRKTEPFVKMGFLLIEYAYEELCLAEQWVHTRKRELSDAREDLDEMVREWAVNNARTRERVAQEIMRRVSAKPKGLARRHVLKQMRMHAELVEIGTTRLTEHAHPANAQTAVRTLEKALDSFDYFVEDDPYERTCELIEEMDLAK